MSKVISKNVCGMKGKVISYRRMYISELNKFCVKLDSNYEYNYAQYLDYLLRHKKIKYWFRNTTRLPLSRKIVCRGRVLKTYTPDFWIITNKDKLELHEVKGWMNDRSIKIINQLKKDYKDIKTVIIDKREMLKLQNKYKSVLKDWVQIR